MAAADPSPSPSAAPPLEIEPAELAAALGADDADAAAPLLLDCRTPAEHETARLEPCLLIPMDELGARVDELRPHADRPLVVYCHGGVRSLRVAVALRRAGFEQARSLAGGIDRWSCEIDPSVPRY